MVRKKKEIVRCDVDITLYQIDSGEKWGRVHVRDQASLEKATEKFAAWIDGETPTYLVLLGAASSLVIPMEMHRKLFLRAEEPGASMQETTQVPDVPFSSNPFPPGKETSEVGPDKYEVLPPPEETGTVFPE